MAFISRRLSGVNRKDSVLLEGKKLSCRMTPLIVVSGLAPRWAAKRPQYSHADFTRKDAARGKPAHYKGPFQRAVQKIEMSGELFRVRLYLN